MNSRVSPLACPGLPPRRWPVRIPAILNSLILAAIAQSGLQAEFLQPVDVTVSNGEEIKDTLIDGNGFEDPGVGSPDSVHITASSEMWSSVGSVRAELVFDLGKTVDLTRVFLWNFNAGTDTDVGMKDVDVFVSPDANPATAKFTGIASVSLTEGGSAAQAFPVSGTDVRLVKLRNTSNWGNGYRIGLAEARFESGDIAGNVPVVSITGLKNGDTVPLASDFALAATVTDKDSNLSKVEFFDGKTKLGETNRAPFTVSLKSLAQGDHSLRVVATDATGLKAFDTVDVSVREIVPGKVIQIDDTRDRGTNLNQIRYVGTWNVGQGNANDPRFLNADRYSDSSSAYYEVRFVGVKIDIFATVASHHGTAAAVIDGGTRYVINYKATQRGEQKLIWSSPLLPNREHVLRVSVLGTGVVTADRFDVTQSDTPSTDRAVVKRWEATLDRFTIDLEDLGTSRVDTNTVVLRIDGAAAPVSVSRSGALTTVVYVAPAPFAPGSVRPFRIEARDLLGNVIASEATFTVPAPPFPGEGLGGPAGAAGAWGVRQVWGGGRADAVVTAVELARAATTQGFTGRKLDTTAPVVNFELGADGFGGLFPDEAPFPAEAEGLGASDWITIARARVRIPRTGDWTFGIRSDDGFALRFAGHPFASVSGGGRIDEEFPEYVLFPLGTADSNTRAVLKGLRAGDYGVEFLHFQRSGGAHAEVYAAEGAFTEDADTGDWALIGGPGGLELVAEEAPPAGPFRLGRLGLETGRMTLDFESPRPTGRHTLEESADLRSWTPVPSATFAPTTGRGVRATTTTAPTGTARFYRVSVAAP
jgi:hypothetical protein